MPICRLCGKDAIVTLDNICLICNPPNAKQTDTIVKLLILVTDHIRNNKKKIKK